MSKPVHSNLDFQGLAKILNLPDPTSAQDAATRAYVLAAISAALQVNPGQFIGASITAGGAAQAAAKTGAQLASALRFSDDQWITLDNTKPTYNATFDAHYGVVIDPNATVVRIIPSGDVRIASFEVPTVDGHEVRLYQDTGGATSVTLLHQDANEATTARRLALGGADLRLVNLQLHRFNYTRSLWRLQGERTGYRVDVGSLSRVNQLNLESGSDILITGTEDTSINRFTARIDSKVGVVQALSGSLPTATGANTNLSCGAYSIPGNISSVGTLYELTGHIEFVHTAAATPTITIELLFGGSVLLSLVVTPTASAGTYSGDIVAILRFTTVGSSGAATASIRCTNGFGTNANNQNAGASSNFLVGLNTTLPRDLQLRVRMTTGVASNTLTLYNARIERKVY
jgi:hypothetical protein